MIRVRLKDFVSGMAVRTLLLLRRPSQVQGLVEPTVYLERRLVGEMKWNGDVGAR